MMRGSMVVKTPNKAPFHRTPAFPVLMLQLVVTLGVALVLWLFQGLVAGYSGLLGGLVALIPNSYFAFRVFRYSGARSARAIGGELYSGAAVTRGWWDVWCGGVCVGCVVTDGVLEVARVGWYGQRTEMLARVCGA